MGFEKHAMKDKQYLTRIIQEDQTSLYCLPIQRTLQNSLCHALRQQVPHDLKTGVYKVRPGDVEIGQQAATVHVRIA
jgi:hypothetical protein